MSRFLDPVRLGSGIRIDRRNLVPNPSFEADVAGWQQNSRCTISRSTAWSASGSACLRALVNGAAGSGAVNFQQAVSTVPRVTPGNTYTASCKTRAATVGRNVQITIWWWSATGALVGGYQMNPAGLKLSSTTADTTLTCTVVAPAGAATGTPVIDMESAAASGEAHYFDAFLFEEAATADSYFDGDSPGYRWSGTHHRSVSESLLDIGGNGLARLGGLPTGVVFDGIRRVNLISNPSFEVDTAGWFAMTNCTINTSATWTKVGSKSLAVTCTTAGTVGALYGNNLTAIPVTAGQTYSASCVAFTGVAGRQMRLQADWLDDAQTFIATTTGPLVAVAANMDTALTATWQVPVGATKVKPYTSILAAAVNDVYYFDTFMLEKSTTVGTYFDGNTAGYRWTGVAHNSTSEGAFDLNGNPLINLPAPVSAGDAATKSYVDNAGVQPVFNVKSAPYNAKGDGTTDDSAAIRAAVIDANSAGGGTVYFPKGVYRIATIGYNLADSARGVKLVGQAGMASPSAPAVRLVNDTALASGNTGFSMESTAGLEVRNIQFEISAVANSLANVFSFYNSTDLTVSNCVFTNTSANTRFGVGYVPSLNRASFDHCLFSNLNRAFQGDSSKNVTIRESNFTNNAAAVYRPDGQWQIEGCAIDCGAGLFAVDCAATSSSVVNLLVQNCRITSTAANTSGLLKLSGQGLVVQNNYFDCGTGVAIRTATSLTAGLVVVGNSFVNASTAVDFFSPGNVTGAFLAGNNFTSVTSRYLQVPTNGLSTILDDGNPVGPRATDVQVYTNSSTWTKPTGAQTVHVVCVAGGAGGGSGYRGGAGTDRTGGSGGGGGSVSRVELPASVLPATVAVFVGGGGGGGASPGADGPGNNGSAGGTSIFGPSQQAAYAQGTPGFAGQGGIAGTSRTQPQFVTTGMFPGGVGGASSNAAGAGAAYPNASAAGGGGGGGLNAANTPAAGGEGGTPATNPATPAGGGAAGAAGVAGTSQPANSGLPGSGGGGGGSSGTGAGGNGGAGGSYGGGGGGGGASAPGFASGAGGIGAAGIVIVTTRF